MAASHNMIKNETMITVGGIVLIAVGAAWAIKKAGGAIGSAATAVTDTAAGIVTGNNAVTAAARTDAYQGAGILGTMGAATDIASGGLFSRVGEWIGGKVADLTIADPITSGGIQPANGQRSATSGGAHGAY